MAADILTLHLDEGLQQLLPRKLRQLQNIAYPLTRRSSIKDVIEALHIPHTEVFSIVQKGEEILFSSLPQPGEQLYLSSFAPGTDVTQPTSLRPTPLAKTAFIVDINVGKLARLLRMSGFDTRYEPRLHEAELADLAVSCGCILLSRNRDLLRRKIVTWGHLVRAVQPEIQLAEVVALYGLEGCMKPFSRCLECNMGIFFLCSSLHGVMQF